MSILERCPSYKESNKRSKERQGPTLGVRFTEVSISEVYVKRESTVQSKPVNTVTVGVIGRVGTNRVSVLSASWY